MPDCFFYYSIMTNKSRVFMLIENNRIIYFGKCYANIFLKYTVIKQNKI